MKRDLEKTVALQWVQKHASETPQDLKAFMKGRGAAHWIAALKRATGQAWKMDGFSTSPGTVNIDFSGAGLRARVGIYLPRLTSGDSTGMFSAWRGSTLVAQTHGFVVDKQALKILQLPSRLIDAGVVRQLQKAVSEVGSFSPEKDRILGILRNKDIVESAVTAIEALLPNIEGDTSGVELLADLDDQVLEVIRMGGHRLTSMAADLEALKTKIQSSL